MRRRRNRFGFSPFGTPENHDVFRFGRGGICPHRRFLRGGRGVVFAQGLPHPLRARRERGTRQAGGTHPVHAGARARQAAETHGRGHGGHRHFGRAGFFARSAGRRAGVRPHRKAEKGHPRRHHAGVRHDGQDVPERPPPHRLRGGDLPHRRYFQKRSRAFQGYRPRSRKEGRHLRKRAGAHAHAHPHGSRQPDGRTGRGDGGSERTRARLVYL